jgi:hypothetical protein
MKRSNVAWSSITHAQWASRSDPEIAHALGVSVALVRQRRRMFGHPNPRARAARPRSRATRTPWPAPPRSASDTPHVGRPPVCDWSAIPTEAWASRTNTDLARELGVTAGTVAKWRERLGAPPTPGRPPKGD